MKLSALHTCASLNFVQNYTKRYYSHWKQSQNSQNRWMLSAFCYNTFYKVIYWIKSSSSSSTIYSMSKNIKTLQMLRNLRIRCNALQWVVIWIHAD